jgi:hypothetical protein
MAAAPPLPALLSAAFVAFTIEADNEAERQLPHTTTSFGATEPRAGWLTSLAMWFNCLRGLADDGPLTVAELERQARMSTNLDGMRRWGWITIDGVGRVKRGTAKPRAKPGSELALTRRGRAADAVWRPLPALVEERWRARFGGTAIDRLRSALLSITQQIALPLPDFMPIRGFDRGIGNHSSPRTERERDSDAGLSLASLLARVLMQFQLDYEAGRRLPLAAWSNLVRVLDTETGVPVAELPRLTGVSKEAVAMMTGRLQRVQCLVVEPLADGRRGRQVRLTGDRGARVSAGGRRRLEATLGSWEQRYETERVAAVRSALVAITGDGTRAGSPLFAGLEPPPDGWRARVKPAQTLPWHPMVSHRGGYPDGS